MRIAACGIDDREPLAIMGHRYVRRCTRERNRLIEDAAAAVAEEY
jgi:hypothetical protein